MIDNHKLPSSYSNFYDKGQYLRRSKVRQWIMGKEGMITNKRKPYLLGMSVAGHHFDMCLTLFGQSVITQRVAYRHKI